MVKGMSSKQGPSMGRKILAGSVLGINTIGLSSILTVKYSPISFMIIGNCLHHCTRVPVDWMMECKYVSRTFSTSI